MGIRELLESGPISKKTRFKAFTLETAGSCFSYYDGEEFTLIEARLPENNALENEMRECEVTNISTLHITSWDQDHCNLGDLKKILDNLKPNKIEAPGYEPDTEVGKNCRQLIETYKKEKKKRIIFVTPEYIESLKPASPARYKNVYFHPKTTWEKANDNSTIKFFRSGMFNVLSLGDVEHEQIGALLKRSSLRKEIDILILPHHGAESKLLTKNLLEILNPAIAICSSNHGNRYDHPSQNIRTLLNELKIELYTSKSADVLIESIGSHRADYQVSKTQKNKEKKTDTRRSKKYISLNKHADNLKKPNKINIKR